MKEVTEVDFEKLRKLIQFIKDSHATPTYNAPHEQPYVVHSYDEYEHELQSLYRPARPVIDYLVDYYYKEIDHTGEELGTDSAYPSLPKRLAVLKILDMGEHRRVKEVLEDNATLFNDAMKHHEQATVDKLKVALGQTLGNITGEQLILVLNEYDRRKNATS